MAATRLGAVRRAIPGRGRRGAAPSASGRVRRRVRRTRARVRAGRQLTEVLTLDAASNLSARSGPARSFQYDGANRVTHDGSRAYTWSAADQLTSRGEDSFGYDAQDRLLGADVAGTAHTYTYDGDGLLASRASPLATSFLWDPATSPQRLVQAGTDRIVHGLGPLYIARADGTTTTLAQDGLGSIRAEVGDAGLITGSFRYRAYGELARSSGLGPTLLGYAGQLTDPSGLVYMRARWYDPEAGRFLTRDPHPGEHALPVSLNAFLYAHARPTLLTDPTGACPFCRAVINAITGLFGRAAPSAARAEPSIDRSLPAEANIAYETARQGGLHAGTLRNYMDRDAREIARAVRSLERRAEQHLTKAQRAHELSEEFDDPRELQGLVHYWLKEAARYRAEADVLRGLLEEVLQ